jgi:pimeloyl-ACP methyl ester carboxylesterase
MTGYTRMLVAAALLFTLAACGGDEPPPIDVPDGAAAGDVSLEPCTYTARDVEYTAECGLFVVPENRSDSASRVIALPVSRVRATGNAPAEPIFFLEGGPGISNMRFTRLAALIDRHDIVMVGYRGVDGSVVLDCPELTQTMKSLTADLLEKATMDSVASAYANCAERLHGEGVDTDGYTLTEVVQDMEDARVALGYGRVDLLSESYGTRLALIYAWLYPESVHRSAMIGVNPPGHFIWDPGVIDDQLEYYGRLCAQDVECSQKTESLTGTMRNVVADLPDRWFFLRIKRGNVLAGTFMMLYHTDTAAKVFDAWLAAEAGDASGLALLSLAIDLMLPAATTWGESMAKAASSDYVYDPGRDFMSEMNPPGSIIGAPTSGLGWAGAKGWPGKLIAEELRQVQESDVEMLLIGGDIDFSTPAQAATEELLPYLSNGRQVILSEFGHTGDVWNLQPEATARLLASFYDTGVADTTGYSYHPVDFHVGLGYPEMAKLMLAAPALILVLLAALVWFVVRKLRRRSAPQS